VQRLPLDVLHGVVAQAQFLTNGKDLGDIGMIEACGQTGLAAKALYRPFVGGVDERQELEGNPAIPQRQLLGLKDQAHTPLADLADDAEIADGLAFEAIQTFLAHRSAPSKSQPNQFSLRLQAAPAKIKVQIGPRCMQSLSAIFACFYFLGSGSKRVKKGAGCFSGRMSGHHLAAQAALTTYRCPEK
jgi:hypothetical protein